MTTNLFFFPLIKYYLVSFSVSLIAALRALSLHCWEMYKLNPVRVIDKIISYRDNWHTQQIQNLLTFKCIGQPICLDRFLPDRRHSLSNCCVIPFVMLTAVNYICMHTVLLGGQDRLFSSSPFPKNLMQGWMWCMTLPVTHWRPTKLKYSS